MSQKKSPRFELRSGNVDALLLALQTADMAALRDDLLSRFEATPDFLSCAHLRAATATSARWVRVVPYSCMCLAAASA
ncbi:hypothetical protein AWV79_37960 [Cupriavidus sp. UYMMa02A]|nr:hypothetical protein AWV79_37960 [Cupriavidus sp. UYMMa02A]